MATIWKRKDRDVWVVDYRDPTGLRVRVTAANRQQAEDLLAEKIKARKHAPTNREDRDITLAAYVTRWLKAAVGHLAPATHQNYTQHLTLHILPVLGPLRVCDLRRRHVKDLLAKLRSNTNAQGRPFSKNSLRLIKAALSTVLTDAVDDEIIFANPVMQLGQGKKRSATRMTTDDVLSRLRPMTWLQVQTFEQTLSTLHRDNLLDARYAMLFVVLTKTGMRPGEALALHPGDLDLVNRTMRVERAATMGGQVKSTKTNEVRTVDLSASLLPKLVAYQSWLELETMAGRWGDTPWLFPNDQGKLFEERHIRRVVPSRAAPSHSTDFSRLRLAPHLREPAPVIYRPAAVRQSATRPCQSHDDVEVLCTMDSHGGPTLRGHARPGGGKNLAPKPGTKFTEQVFPSRSG